LETPTGAGPPPCAADAASGGGRVQHLVQYDRHRSAAVRSGFKTTICWYGHCLEFVRVSRGRGHVGLANPVAAADVSKTFPRSRRSRGRARPRSPARRSLALVRRRDLGIRVVRRRGGFSIVVVPCWPANEHAAVLAF